MLQEQASGNTRKKELIYGNLSNCFLIYLKLYKHLFFNHPPIKRNMRCQRNRQKFFILLPRMSIAVFSSFSQWNQAIYNFKAKMMSYMLFTVGIEIEFVLNTKYSLKKKSFSPPHSRGGPAFKFFLSRQNHHAQTERNQGSVFQDIWDLNRMQMLLNGARGIYFHHL